MMKKKSMLKQLIRKRNTAAAVFHTKTHISHFSHSHGNAEQNAENPKQKAYSRMQALTLPKPRLSEDISLFESLVQRKSSRQFKKKSLTLTELSTVLYYSSGIREQIPLSRFYPSAGKRYPLEVYIISLHMPLKRRIYHYYPPEHILEELFPVTKSQVTELFEQDWTTNSSCLLILTAVFDRTYARYGNRGYRHLMQEAGYLGQNIYLLSAALSLSCCAIGGYIDSKINNLLDLDEKKESVVSVVTLGKI